MSSSYSCLLLPLHNPHFCYSWLPLISLILQVSFSLHLLFQTRWAHLRLYALWLSPSASRPPVLLPSLLPLICFFSSLTSFPEFNSSFLHQVFFQLLPEGPTTPVQLQLPPLHFLCAPHLPHPQNPPPHHRPLIRSCVLISIFHRLDAQLEGFWSNFMFAPLPLTFG